MPEVGDLLAMTIEISGKKDERRKGYKYTVLEYFDHEAGVRARTRCRGT
jgi:hypothetical protein